VPIAALVQKAVDRSASVISSRWTSAAPSAKSESTNTRLEKTSAIAASPRSLGVSRRARTTVDAIAKT
jgi:hypothetical protein